MSNSVSPKGLTAALFVLSLGRTVLFFVMCMTSSRNLHNRMFQSVIRVPIKFFDTHPVGKYSLLLLSTFVVPDMSVCLVIGFVIFSICDCSKVLTADTFEISYVSSTVRRFLWPILAVVLGWKILKFLVYFLKVFCFSPAFL